MVLPESFISHHPEVFSGHPARPATRRGWRSAARRCAGTFIETPPYPQAGGEAVIRPHRLQTFNARARPHPRAASQRFTSQVITTNASTTAAMIHQLMVEGSSSAAVSWTPNTDVARTPGEIGRASCRERV